MATTRKPAKRSTRKKAAAPTRRAAASGAKSRKRTAAKKSTRKARTSNSPKLKGTARRGLRLAKEGLHSVRQAGGKAWQAVKQTTSEMVENVSDE